MLLSLSFGNNAWLCFNIPQTVLMIEGTVCATCMIGQIKCIKEVSNMYSCTSRVHYGVTGIMLQAVTSVYTYLWPIYEGNHRKTTNMI